MVPFDNLWQKNFPSYRNLPDFEAFVYCLGAVLWHALEYGSPAGGAPVRLDASPQLLSLLNLMTVADANIRPTVGRIKQVKRSVHFC